MIIFKYVSSIWLKSTFISHIRLLLHKTTLELYCRTCRIAVLRQLNSVSAISTKRDIGIVGNFDLLLGLLPGKSFPAFFQLTTYLITQRSSLVDPRKLILKVGSIFIFRVGKLIASRVDRLNDLRFNYLIVRSEITSIKLEHSTVNFQVITPWG